MPSASPAGAIRRLLVIAAALVPGAAACRDATAPAAAPPYLAIVTRVDGDASLALAQPVRYRVREFSGTLGIDRTIVASARDTIILPVPPATYEVELAGVPDACGIREGSDRAIVVPPNSNTALVRYTVTCRTLLTIGTATDGPGADTQFVATVRDAAGRIAAARLVGGNGQLRLNALAPGEHTVALDLVDPHCVVASPGGARVPVAVSPAGGAQVDFRIVCSDPARRPTLLSVAATHHDGILGIVFRATDPDADIERYTFDVTDCAGRSLLPGGAQLRRGLGAGRTARQDTITVMVAQRTGLSDDVARSACVALRVADQYENSTAVAQRPLALRRGRPPVPVLDARYVGTQLVRTTLQATDPDGDLLGVVVTAIARDGSLVAPADGLPDVGYYNRVGYLGTSVPDLPFTATFRWNDLYAVVAYVFDAAGNFTIVEDQDLFR